MKVDLSSFNNDWYQKEIGASFLRTTIWYFVNTLVFRTGIFPFSSLKIFLLRRFGARIGTGLILKPYINIKYPWKLTIGDHCWIGENVWIDNLATVKIGNHVCLSQGAYLLTGNHDYSRTSFDLMIGGISLEDGVWIGAQSVVCPGVICHSHAVLTVQSVATKELEPYTIYQGNPAIAVKKRIVI